MSRLNKKEPEKEIPEVKAQPDDDTKALQEFAQKANEEAQAESKEEAKPVETPKPEPEPAPVADNNERTYMLRHGSDASFPIRYPNGQTVTVVFKNGMKTLSGRLSNMFHAEYMSNPFMRTKISLVDNAQADKVAKSYVKSRGPVANTGFTSAHNSKDLREQQVIDAEIRHMQQRAAQGGQVEELVLPHTLRTENEA